jgi:hypothetical protein
MGRHRGTGGIPLRQGTGATSAPELKAPAGSAGCTEQEGGGLRGVPHVERSSDRQRLQEARRRFRASGGPKGQAAAILAPEIGKRDPPVRRYRIIGSSAGFIYLPSGRFNLWKMPVRMKAPQIDANASMAYVCHRQYASLRYTKAIISNFNNKDIDVNHSIDYFLCLFKTL